MFSHTNYIPASVHNNLMKTNSESLPERWTQLFIRLCIVFQKSCHPKVALIWRPHGVLRSPNTKRAIHGQIHFILNLSNFWWRRLLKRCVHQREWGRRIKIQKDTIFLGDMHNWLSHFLKDLLQQRSTLLMRCLEWALLHIFFSILRKSLLLSPLPSPLRAQTGSTQFSNSFPSS